MEFLVTNFSINNSSLLESKFDGKMLKDIPYGSKMKDKKLIDYNFVLVPINESIPTESFKEMESVIQQKTTHPSTLELGEKELFALFSFLEKGEIQGIELDRMTIDAVVKVSDDDFDIFYSDGSFNKKTSQASYAVCQLLESGEGPKDSFTGKEFKYELLSGVIEEGTNNIGELTGIKTVSENFGEKKIQLIISDSEYSIKAFREWIYNWKNNGYKTYSGKPIANRELIETTFNQLFSEDKIVLFKWTKGHNLDSFNEVCDVEAKRSIGIA